MVHVLKCAISGNLTASYILFLPSFNNVFQKKDFTAFMLNGYSAKNLKLNCVQKHLPRNWNKQEGYFMNGKKIEIN